MNGLCNFDHVSYNMVKILGDHTSLMVIMSNTCQYARLRFSYFCYFLLIVSIYPETILSLFTFIGNAKYRAALFGY